MIPWFSLNHNVAGSDEFDNILDNFLYTKLYIGKIKVKQRLMEEQG